MPISSGATVKQGQGSYLKRYLGTLSQEKRENLEDSLKAESVSEAAKGTAEGLQEDHQRPTSSDEDSANQTASKKSSTCIVL